MIPFKKYLVQNVAMCALLGTAMASPLSAQGFTPVEVPETGPDHVFVEQIGNGNRAVVSQGDNAQTAEVRQDGADNLAEVDQSDAGAHIALVTQGGADNTAGIVQEGAGQTVAILSQQGNGNSALLAQTDNGVLGSAAQILQTGSDNSLTLLQDGSDNQARLIQNGDANTLTATQLNSGNRLEWVQDGTGLSDMQITQTGGAAMRIFQSNGTGGSN